MTAGLTATGVLIPSGGEGGLSTVVRAPTLLVGGGADAAVLEINRQALGRLGGPCDLQVVAGAAHLFPEPGALDTVATVARDWFLAHLGARAVPTKEA